MRHVEQWTKSDVRHFDRCFGCILALQDPRGGAAAAAAEVTSSRDGKRKAEVGDSPSVRVCFQCCGSL